MKYREKLQTCVTAQYKIQAIFGTSTYYIPLVLLFHNLLSVVQLSCMCICEPYPFYAAHWSHYTASLIMVAKTYQWLVVYIWGCGNSVNTETSSNPICMRVSRLNVMIVPTQVPLFSTVLQKEGSRSCYQLRATTCACTLISTYLCVYLHLITYVWEYVHHIICKVYTLLGQLYHIMCTFETYNSWLWLGSTKEINKFSFILQCYGQLREIF